MKRHVQNLIRKLRGQPQQEPQAEGYEYISSATPYARENFVVVANNCWRAEIYKQADKPFNTPFIGLYLYAEDYIRLLENFDLMMNSPLAFTKKSKWLAGEASYPVGLLNGDIEIHFLHYKTEEEALEKWTRRTERLLTIPNRDGFYFKMCDRDGATEDLVRRFHQLDFKNKLSFGIEAIPELEHHIQVEEREGQTVPDGVQLFRITNKYIDLPHWINTGLIKKI